MLNTTVVLAVIVLALGVVQWIHPLPGLARVNPGVSFIVAALLLARYAARRQALRRMKILDAVPRRPLGLSDDSPDLTK
jgi:hypothetical protein